MALLGRGGGMSSGQADHEVVFPGETSERIQELHMIVLHTLVADVERALFA